MSRRHSKRHSEAGSARTSSNSKRDHASGRFDDGGESPRASKRRRTLDTRDVSSSRQSTADTTPDRHSASASSKIRDKTQRQRKSEPKPEPEVEVEAVDDGVYIVERILARSLEKTLLKSGAEEYLYLVRWEGYGPRDDTWEAESTVMDGAADLVRQFNSRDHPFTILSSRGSKPRSYRVRFGLGAPYVAQSPLYQEVWMTMSGLKAIGCCSREGITRAVARFHTGNGKRGVLSRRVEDESEDEEDEEDEVDEDDDDDVSEADEADGSESDESTYDGRKQPQAHRIPPTSPHPAITALTQDLKLLTLTDRNSYKRKHNSTNWTGEWNATWLDGKKRKEGWWSTQQLYRRFGKERAKEEIARYWDGVRLAEEKLAAKEPVVNEYEVERLRRIQENLDMMKQLGLVM